MQGSALMHIIELVLKDTGVLFLVMGGVIAIVAITLGGIGSIVRTSMREKTRREIAAYIAEGSMTPEQGERLLRESKRPPGD